MKIIMHLIGTSFYGGPEKQIIEHIQCLKGSEYKGIVASFLEKDENNEIIEKAQNYCIEAVGIPMRGPLDFSALLKLMSIIKKKKVDLLCSHGFKSAFFGMIANKLIGVKTISFSRGYTKENVKVSFYEWLERFSIKHVDGIVNVSAGQKRKLAELGVLGKKSWVVHNCVSTEDIVFYNNKKEFCKKNKIPEDAIIIVAAGRLSPEKGHRFLVEAIPKIILHEKNAYFFICGAGVCRDELESLAIKLGIITHCFFEGFVRDIGNYYSIMDLMVLPSLTEGLPNVILEAFAYSKPVVATNVGGVPEIVEDGKNGYLVEAGNSEGIIQSVLECLRKKNGSELGKAGYFKIITDFTFQKQAEQLKNIYNEVCL